MKALLDYALALDGQDARKIASLFSKNCLFNDGALRALGYPDMVAKTPDELVNVFEALFKQSAITVKIKQMLPHAMIYSVTFDGKEFFCIGCAALDVDGKIKEYIVRPL